MLSRANRSEKLPRWFRLRLSVARVVGRKSLNSKLLSIGKILLFVQLVVPALAHCYHCENAPQLVGYKCRGDAKTVEAVERL